jgi:hypothetical protein
MTTALYAAFAVVLLLALLAIARHHYRSRLERWRELLEPAGRDLARGVAERCELDLMMSNHAFGAAQDARRRLELEEAVRLLELALRVIEDATPGRVERLRVMGRLVRMSMAILPLEAVPAARFRLRQVGLLARVGALLDLVLVAPAERMAVRLRVLALGFLLTLHVLRSSRRAVAERPDGPAAWDRFRLALNDWQALDDEHLRSVRVLVQAVAVEMKREEIAHGRA